MIVIRPRRAYAFRERAPEWILSIGLIVMGCMLLASPDIFTGNAYYEPLLSVMSQDSWAIWEISIGTFRVIALAINGMWRPTAHLRAIGAVGGVTIWASLFIISVINVAARAPGIGTFGMLLAFDFMTLWFAAGDAKVVDEVAKKQREINGR